MKTTDTFTAVIATILMTLTCNAVEPWRITQATDPMTDETSYMVYTTGSEVTMSEYLAYQPELVIRITPKNATASGGMMYKADIMISIETDGLRRGNTPITIRYDRDAPSTEDWDTSTDRHAAFFPDWKSAMSKLGTSTNLTVRYTTTLGYIRTTRFDVRNLQPTLKEVKRRYISTHPPVKSPTLTKSDERETESNAHETELIAKATTSMKDIRHALEYARTRTGPMPSMKSETTLNKPLAALENAIAKKKQAADTLENIERRFNNLKPGSISRPSPEKLDRARATLKNAEKELDNAVAEVHNKTRKILQETDWPTPELSAKAESMAARIPYRGNL